MDEFNNGQQNNNPNLYEQSNQNFNEQPNGAVQFGGDYNTNGGQPQYNQYNPNMNQPQESKGLSIAALCCGIFGFVGCFINTWVALILSIAAIVLGVLGRKKAGKGMATAGMVLGIVSIVLWAIAFLLIVVAGVAFISLS